MNLDCKRKKSSIVLTNDYLVITKGIFKRKFKRDKIRSIKITGDNRISILYGDVVYSIILDNIYEENFISIKEIFNLLNSEQILFYSEDNRIKEFIYLSVCIMFWILSIISVFFMTSLTYILFTMGLGYFLGLVYLRVSLQYSYTVLYKVNNSKFTIKYGLNKIMAIPLSDDQYKIKYDREKHKYLLRKNNKKILSFYNGVVYPTYYKDHLNNMMKKKLEIN